MNIVERRDWALLAVGVPLFVAVLALHLTEATQRGLAEPPVWVIAVWGDDYPAVGGYRVGSPSNASDLRAGDRVLRVDGRDLAGHAYAGFQAIVLAEAAADHEVIIDYERDGVAGRAEVEVMALENPYVRFPGFTLAMVVAVVVLLRARERSQARLLFVAFALTSIFELPFHGPREWQTLASVFVFTAAGTIAFPLIWITLVRLPGVELEGSPLLVRLLDRYAWWIGAAFLLPRIGYSYGVPFDPAWLTRIIQLVDAIWMVGIVALFVTIYRYGTARTRRRVRWIALGCSLGISHLLISGLALAFDPDGPWFVLQYPFAGLVPLLIPLSLWVSIIRFNLLDVDRILSATATLGLLVALFVVALVTAVPFAATWIAESLGVTTFAAQIALVLPVAGAIVPATRRLYPRMDALLFPARVEFQRGVSELLAELPQALSETEVLQLVARRLTELFEPRSSALYHARDEGMHLIQRSGANAMGDVAPSPALLEDLETDGEPWLVEGADGGDRRDELADVDLAFSKQLDVALMLPILRPDGLCAVLCLGPRKNGDVYTRTDLALLSAVCHQATASVGALLQADALVSMRRERASADEANRAKSQLIASASHDLRQPVHALGLLIGMLEEVHDPEEIEKVSRRMRVAVDSLQELLSSVLEVSKLDAGVIEPDVISLPVGPVVERIGDEFASLARAAGLGFRVCASRAVVKSDPVLLTRIIRNLAMNAIRYTERGGVLIGCRTRGDYVLIQVWDTGPGIPEARQAEIFEEYHQLEGQASKAGLGLGLSIVTRLCGLLDHEVSLRSRVGRGTVFEVRVARSRERVQPTLAAAGAAPLEGRRVLVIDDDRAIRDATLELLQRWGCDVRTARGGDEALAALEGDQWKPELVLADYRLEGETGLDVVASLSDRINDLRAAIISGEHEAEIAERVAAQGLPLIAKPLSAPRLRALIGRLLPRPGAG